MTTAHHFENGESVICPVKDLVVGDFVRDFYKEPSYGIVTEVNPTFDGGRGLARVLWDGDRVTTTLRFRAAGGKRGDIIRRRRPDEEEGLALSSAEFLAHPSHVRRGKVDDTCGICKVHGAVPVRWLSGNLAAPVS